VRGVAARIRPVPDACSQRDAGDLARVPLSRRQERSCSSTAAASAGGHPRRRARRGSRRRGAASGRADSRPRVTCRSTTRSGRSCSPRAGDVERRSSPAQKDVAVYAEVGDDTPSATRAADGSAVASDRRGI
jgi:hypothetical protein